MYDIRSVISAQFHDCRIRTAAIHRGEWTLTVQAMYGDPLSQPYQVVQVSVLVCCGLLQYWTWVVDHKGWTELLCVVDPRYFCITLDPLRNNGAL